MARSVVSGWRCGAYLTNSMEYAYATKEHRCASKIPSTYIRFHVWLLSLSLSLSFSRSRTTSGLLLASLLVTSLRLACLASLFR
ncbi:hypothetical protein K491DRAFT_694089 [Lophiostoma macrostomum CBS 122681]|uniref:Uncharacterized protein n=1 Tax=Lophiostoma macrostomum CBS 122681 TaxID=1314788 RepID=A0A6A6T2M2_9PLEO|nr:hypothetical protein K491DRAFT_694089 [Lophiostoma macrostomum CBS 122681]